jgi:hypothetical protein
MTAKQQPASVGLTQVGGVAGLADASAAKPRALVFQTWAMVVVAYLSFCRQLGSHTRRGKGSERCGDEFRRGLRGKICRQLWGRPTIGFFWKGNVSFDPRSRVRSCDS